MTKLKKTLYELLEVSATASLAEIKQAYEAATNSLENKPETVDDDEAKIQRQAIDMAYSVLSNQVSREAYDAKLLASQAEMAAAPQEVLEKGKRSLLSQVLIVLMGLIAMWLLVQLIVKFSFDPAGNLESAEPVSLTAEELKIEEYYRTHGVRPANGAEVDWLMAKEKQQAEKMEKARELRQQDQEYQQWLNENQRMSEDLDRQWMKVEEEAQKGFEAELLE